MFENLPKDVNLTALITTAVIVFVIGFIINLFFCWSMNKALKLVPEQHYLFPRWFVWLMLIPIVSIIFQWLMLPFGIPRAFEKKVAGNEPAVKDTRTIFALGLAFVILVTAALIPYVGIVGIAALIIWIIYWYKVVKFRRTYLDPGAPGSSVSSSASST